MDCGSINKRGLILNGYLTFFGDKRLEYKKDLNKLKISQ
jgi:hypothetical protein